MPYESNRTTIDMRICLCLFPHQSPYAGAQVRQTGTAVFLTHIHRSTFALRSVSPFDHTLSAVNAVSLHCLPFTAHCSRRKEDKSLVFIAEAWSYRQFDAISHWQSILRLFDLIQKKIVTSSSTKMLDWKSAGHLFFRSLTVISQKSFLQELNLFANSHFFHGMLDFFLSSSLPEWFIDNNLFQSLLW